MGTQQQQQQQQKQVQGRAHLAEGAVVPCPEALVAGLGLLPRLPQLPLQRRLLGGHVEDDGAQVGELVRGPDPVAVRVRGGAETQPLGNTDTMRYQHRCRASEERLNLE